MKQVYMSTLLSPSQGYYWLNNQSLHVVFPGANVTYDGHLLFCRYLSSSPPLASAKIQLSESAAVD
jgi:hypothetical protein